MAGVVECNAVLGLVCVRGCRRVVDKGRRAQLIGVRVTWRCKCAQMGENTATGFSSQLRLWGTGAVAGGGGALRCAALHAVPTETALGNMRRWRAGATAPDSPTICAVREMRYVCASLVRKERAHTPAARAAAQPVLCDW
ncbi:hypothetical protein FGB62_111g034 [Gracilaria domingensis]|nr:hypothetical protein FGB62_111g034 [Gracilaria domingensis]